MRKNKDGFGHFIAVFALLIAGVIGFAIWYVIDNQNKPEDSQQNFTEQSDTDTDSGLKLNCKPASSGLFTSDVTDLSKVTLIQNPIRVIGGSNIKTHSYIEVSEKTPVYSPMDATLSGGANYYETMGEDPVVEVQYILSFNDGCDVSFWLDHLIDVPEKIKSAFPAEPRDDTQGVDVKEVDVKAGELVGYSNQAGRARFDFGVINLKGPESSLTTNPRFKNDPIVKTSDKYRYATCPYNLYDSDKQKAYQAFYSSSEDGDQEIIDDICD